MPVTFKMDNTNIQSEDTADAFNAYFLNIIKLLKNAYQPVFQSMKVI
jgi:hypothetical protein